MPSEKAASSELVATGLKNLIFGQSSGQVALIVFFRHLDNHSFTIVFDDCNSFRYISWFFLHKSYVLL